MNAKVNIITKQYDGKRHIDTIKVNTDADVYNKNNDIFIIYKEEEEGVKVTSNIKISQDEVTIKRFGNTNSTMVFKEKNIHTSRYRTPQGMFIIETNTKKLNIDRSNENLIKLNIEYNINILDLFQGKNIIDIQIEIQE